MVKETGSWVGFVVTGSKQGGGGGRFATWSREEERGTGGRKDETSPSLKINWRSNQIYQGMSNMIC